MSVDFDSFHQWAEERFPGEVVVKGKEIKLNSVFADDHKKHLWCNTGGGKHHRDDGVFRCFYTEKRGTLATLIMYVDGCSYEEAKEILSGDTPIGILEDKLDEFFKEKEQVVHQEINLKLPEGSFKIDDLPVNNSLRMEASSYLSKRKIPTEHFYVCSIGNYKNRILIPYYDAKDKLIYFNTRNMQKWGLRYLGPPKEIGVGKADVIYAVDWPKKGSKIHLTEGEFDAYTLFLCGYNGMACGGKNISDQQIMLIKDYKVCLALDEDSSGLSGLKMMAERLMAYQVPDITYVRPPKGIKDWNKMLVMFKPEILQAYINANEKRFDDFTNVLL